MIKEKPITMQDIERMTAAPAGRIRPVKIMNKKGTTPIDRHYKLLDRIINSYR